MKFIKIFLVGLFFLSNVILAYNNLQNTSPIFGLKLGGQFLFGKNYTQLINLITKQFQQVRKISFTYQNQTFVLTPKDLGLSIDPSQTATMLLQTGRVGNFLQKLLIQEKALFGFVDQPLPTAINSSLLAVKVLEIQDKINIDPLPERPNFLSDLNQTLPASAGTQVDVEKLSKIVNENINLSGEKTFSLPIKTSSVRQHYSEDDLVSIRKQAAKIFALRSVGLIAAGETFTLTSDDLRQMLTVAERPDPKDPKKFMLVLRLNDKMLNNKLGDFAAKVEAKSHAEFNFQYARIALYAQVFSGKPGPIAINTFNVSG